MEKVKAVIKQTILNLKYLISTPGSLFFLLFLTIAPYSISLFFIPLHSSFSVLILMSVVMPTGIVYVSTSFNIREGTIYKNMSITNNNKMEFYISSFICMLIVGYILMFFALTTLFVLSNLNLLISDYWWGNDKLYYKILEIPFIPLVYSIFESILILFATCFFMQNIISTKKNMYIFVFSLMILTVIFGGTFNNYYYREQIDPNNIEISIPRFKAMMFPGSVYYVSLFYPLFGPSQHLASIGGTFSWNETVGSFNNRGDNHYKFFTWLTENNSMNTWLQNLGWNILWFAPIFWTTLFGILGTTASKMKYLKK